MMKMSLPSRKQINEDRLNELIEHLSEHAGGDDAIIGELFPMIFADLSAPKQEYYIRMLQDRLKEYQEEIK